MTISIARGRKRFAMGLGLCVLVAATFAPAATGRFIWDDDPNILSSSVHHQPGGLMRIWLDPSATFPNYYPVTYTLFWLQYQLWGAAPAGYHLLNIALHASATLLLWRVLRCWPVRKAGCIALLFAVHPVHVETVAWASELKNVLSMNLALLAVLSWLRFEHAQRWRDYVLATVYFELAVLGKTIVVGLPIVLALREWQHCRRRPSKYPWLIPWLVLALLAGLVTVWREPGANTVPVTGANTLVERALDVSRAIVFQAGTLLWPVKLVAIYPSWSTDVSSVVSWMYLVGVTSTVVALYFLRRRIGRGPLVALLAYVILLGPTLGLVRFDYLAHSPVADHFQYHASPALLSLAVLALMALTRRWHLVLQSALGRVIIGGAVAVLAVMTWHRCTVFADAERLWSLTIADNPMAWAVHNNLGRLLLDRGDLNTARERLEASVAINPHNAQALSNLGSCYRQLGRLSDATGFYRRAIELAPDAYEPHLNLANALLSLGQSGPAVDTAGQAQRSASERGKATEGLGAHRQGPKEFLELAVQHYSRAIVLAPQRTDLWAKLATAELYLGRLDQAQRDFEVAIRHAPTSELARGNYALLLLQAGDTLGAECQWRALLASHPLSVEGHANLGALFLRRNDWREAQQHLQEAIRLSPRNSATHFNLAIALSQLGQDRQALAALDRSLQIDPGFLPAYVGRAWILAASPDDTLRDPKAAVAFAEQTATRFAHESVPLLEAAAVAYAAADRFAESIEAASRALELAQQAGNPAIIKRLQAQLTRSRQGKQPRGPLSP